MALANLSLTMPPIAAMNFPPGVWALGIILAGVAILVALFAFIKATLKRCSSNQVLVKYGMFVGGGKTAKTIHGGATYVIPFVQGFRYLSLEPIQIEIPLRGALSGENIRVNVPSVFTVAIGTQPEVMSNASIRLLDLGTNEIRKQAEEIIFGQLRQVIASMRIEDINRDRDTFLQHIQNSVEPELKKIGLVLINVNITDITDESGYIDAIGQKAASEAIQQARGDVADELRKGEIRVADAEREKAVKVADATKLREIGTREAEREQAVRLAELLKEQTVGEKAAERDRAIEVAMMLKEQTVGEQTAEFEREVQVKEAERQKRIAMAEADATAVDGENIAAARVAKSQAELLVQRAEAYHRGEAAKREAEASVIEVQNRAMAKAALAEAERVEAEKRAEYEAVAKAEKARLIVQAEAEAERIKLEANANAAAVYAKLEAEARGQYEILAKKGEGLKQIVAACGGAREAFQLMMLEHLDTLAETSAKAISNIKFDKVVVWENGSGKDGRSNTADFLQGMTGTLPPMMQVLRDVGGIEVPESLARFMGGDSKEKEPVAPTPKAEANGATSEN
ncbi:flotillin family protein [Botrimarina mediterranea]|uniref:Inner membrane protein YqiK n=1 Tax=Botrimarina mediterranea TaxID=2528022 RepID=A0A518K4Y2_9BACT|nr:flotillin family protein [Botrimarina mediterranea]QDV72835.1 Inner membrane protein YqiK [Botrimarina mediterranea]QDV77407.1 Inner membrane protein YqiK [Planctomycetes bacterium K2D]